MRPRNCPRFCREGSREWWVRIFLKVTDDPWFSSVYANTFVYMWLQCWYTWQANGPSNRITFTRYNNSNKLGEGEHSYRREAKERVVFITSQWLLVWQLDGHFLAIDSAIRSSRASHRSRTPIRLLVSCVLCDCRPANCWRNMMSWIAVTFKLWRAKWLFPRVLRMYIYASGEDPNSAILAAY